MLAQALSQRASPVLTNVVDYTLHLLKLCMMKDAFLTPGDLPRVIEALKFLADEYPGPFGQAIIPALSELFQSQALSQG